MIDETLSRLSRALIVASDKLASEDFLTRQARFVEIEAERAALAESLGADEAAVTEAQKALQQHVLYGAEPEMQPDDPQAEDMVTIKRIAPIDMSLPHMLAAFESDAEADRERYKGFVESAKEETVDVEKYFRPIFGAEDVNEFSSSRANGAYTED